MDKLIIAFATDDKTHLTEEHFGEAKEYLIYEISKTDNKFLKTVLNISHEEKMHSDPNKAKSVASILKPHGVDVLVNKVFGGNITRMQKKFVVILSKNSNIDETLSKIQLDFEHIVTELEKGETRKYFRI
jgi:predicted Fe-Mo cluster-binding NifX family protein